MNRIFYFNSWNLFYKLFPYVISDQTHNFNKARPNLLNNHHGMNEWIPFLYLHVTIYGSFILFLWSLNRKYCLNQGIIDFYYSLSQLWWVLGSRSWEVLVYYINQHVPLMFTGKICKNWLKSAGFHQIPMQISSFQQVLQFTSDQLQLVSE